MEHLIANSGIQLLIREAEFNPTQPLILTNKPLKYNFCDTKDFITNEVVFDLLLPHADGTHFIPYSELKLNDEFEKKPNGLEDIDLAGMNAISSKLALDLYTTYNVEDNADSLVTISSLSSLKVKNPDTKTLEPAFELLLNKWLPMPFFEKMRGGNTTIGVPYGWCRVKIEPLGPGKTPGTNKYRFVWAFDTELATDALQILRPFFDEFESKKEYVLSNHVDELLGFMSDNPAEFSAFSDYISNIVNHGMIVDNHKYAAFYIYLVNYIRIIGAAPEVTLYHHCEGDSKEPIPVDFVLDIGNSRTCGVLFENSDFTKAVMLELRDLTHLHNVYDTSFDMRLAFRQADFGNEIILEEDMFQWSSLVRVGQEAKDLVYRSLEEEGLSELLTNHSSPKRYLWDNEAYGGKWEFLRTMEDPFFIQAAENIYIPRLSDMFNSKGDYIADSNFGIEYGATKVSYSRSSLMTFVLVEILNHAVAQINSVKFRSKHGNIDRKRVIRSIIMTCPTAMPLNEQIKLRQCAMDAYSALRKCIEMPEIKIVPSIKALKNNDEFAELSTKTWSYDEATCCQLVYLYAELVQRYGGDVKKFFELKGKPSVTNNEHREIIIGSIDIGAGTTDIMVCRYSSECNGKHKLTPKPLYWDSFYLAGDDILRKIVQNVVIEGPDYKLKDFGNITSALLAHLADMTDEELLKMPILLKSPIYQAKVDDIVKSHNKDDRADLIRALASTMLRDFFGVDSSMMSYKDRRCRVDFNTQVSHPMSQFFIEQLRRNRPSRVYTFDEIFETNKPAQYLLDFFAEHFGFRFETLSWRFNPEDVAEIVKSTLEPLLKQLSSALYAYKCDVLILAGRPSSLDAVTELFVKYVPVAPNHLVRLNDYQVGSWFPFADGRGYFYDQKAVVAVGGMIGYLASTAGFNGLVLDLTDLIKTMQSTAKFIGEYNPGKQTVPVSLLTPTQNSVMCTLSVFPHFFGCKQFDSASYQARPLYALYNNSGKKTLTLNITRSYTENREGLEIEEIMDEEGNTISKDRVVFRLQSIVNDGKYWLDKGEFELTIK